MLGFARFHTCDRCGATFLGHGLVCDGCRVKAANRRRWAQRRSRVSPHAASPTEAQRAYERGEADQYRAALRGDLD